MRKLLLTTLTLLGLFTCTYATHVIGGNFSYTYTGLGATPGSHVYTVRLNLYKDESGVNLPSTVNVCLTSSSSASQNINLTRLSNPSGTLTGSGGGYIVPGLFKCVGSGAGSISISKHVYEATVTLPTKGKWSLVYDICCRSGVISNGPGNEGMVIYTTINTNGNRGQNNSANYDITDFYKVHCLNKPLNLSGNAFDIDGDSLFFKTVPLIDDFTGCSGDFDHTLNHIAFSAGYSVDTPVATANGFNLDSTNGNLQFIPTQVEVANVGIMAEEWRVDTSNNSRKLVGRSLYDFLISVVANCDTAAAKLTVAPDPILGDTLLAECGDSSIIIKTNTVLSANTIAFDGSDFRVVAASGQLIPISAASLLPNTGGKEIKVTFLDTIKDRGLHHLYIKTGNDGNTIFNDCGFEIESDSLLLKVINCTYIGLDENPAINIDVYPNPTSNQISINVQEDALISIISLDGRTLMKEVKAHQNETKTFDVSPINEGLCFIKVRSLSRPGVFGVKKLMIKRNP